MARKKPEPATADSYYQAMIKAKQAGGLSLEDATAVTSRQRGEDEANPEFALPGTDAEEPPDA